VGTPNRLWCGAAACSSDINFLLCGRGSCVGGSVLSIESSSKSTKQKSLSGRSIFSYRLSTPAMYGQGASSACISRCGRTGISTPHHFIGYIRLTKAEHAS